MCSTAVSTHLTVRRAPRLPLTLKYMTNGNLEQHQRAEVIVCDRGRLTAREIDHGRSPKNLGDRG
jgi:hypothetical protein